MTIIRIEFWNGHCINGRQIKTKHNPCLWSNVNTEENPWRKVYVEAMEVIQKWKQKQLSDQDFLHCLRYVAYGLGKRDFDDPKVVWPGNLSQQHKPKLSIQINETFETVYFWYKNDKWNAKSSKKADFYWKL